MPCIHDGSRDCSRRREGAVWQAAFAALIVGLLAFGPPAIAAGTSKHVLVIYANNRLVPAVSEVDRGLFDSLQSPDTRRVMSAEFLDYPYFNGKEFHDALVTFLREKYVLRPPDVIIAVGEEALDFLLRSRSEFLPLTPVVHLGVDPLVLRAMSPLPADVIGVPVNYDFSGTIEQALRWHPQARRLVLITGAAATDRLWESRLRGEVSRFEDRVTIEFLAGLPTSVLLRRLGQLGKDAVIFTTGYYEDGAGRHFVPREAARMIAAAAKAPVYGPFDTFIGLGIVGGRMTSFEAMGDRQARSRTGCSPARRRRRCTCLTSCPRA